MPCGTNAAAPAAGSGPKGGVTPAQSVPGSIRGTGSTGGGSTATHHATTPYTRAPAGTAPAAPSSSAKGGLKLPIPLPTKPPLTRQQLRHLRGARPARARRRIVPHDTLNRSPVPGRPG